MLMAPVPAVPPELSTFKSVIESVPYALTPCAIAVKLPLVLPALPFVIILPADEMVPFAPKASRLTFVPAPVLVEFA